MSDPKHKGWYNRGYLPHYDAGAIYQMITYRLADSLPKERLEQLERELKLVPPELLEDKRRIMIEKWLDAGHGSCALRGKDNAEIIVNAWTHFDGERYDLTSWVVMPNHVHVLIKVYEGYPLEKIVKSWKSYTSREINKRRECAAGATRSQNTNCAAGATRSQNTNCAAGATRSQNTNCAAGATRSQNTPGRFWQTGYWDRYARNEHHLNKMLEYIKENYDSGGILYGNNYDY
jgi:REP element-mobilizing transposase RayT